MSKQLSEYIARDVDDIPGYGGCIKRDSEERWTLVTISPQHGLSPCTATFMLDSFGPFSVRTIFGEQAEEKTANFRHSLRLHSLIAGKVPGESRGWAGEGICSARR
jgi:hypothetical protein